MEAPVTSSTAESNALSAPVSPYKNTASQPPPEVSIRAAQDSLQRANTPVNITAAPERTITTSHIVNAAQKSLDRAITSSNYGHKPTFTEVLKKTETPVQPASQPRNIETATQDSINVSFAQNSLEKASNKYIPQQTPTINTIVTPQGTWQNVAASSLPQDTLPAVQDFLLKAFETVQRSKHVAMTTSIQNNHSTPLLATPMRQNSVPIAFVTTPLSRQTSLPSPITKDSIPLLPTPMSQNPMPLPFVAKPLSLQTPLPAPFRSVQRMNSLPQPIPNTTPQSPLPDITPFKSARTKSPEKSASLDTPSTNEIKKEAPTSKVEMVSTSQSYPGYTIYNSTLQNPKQTITPKRSVLVAKRHNHVPKTEPETGSPVQTPTSEVLLEQITPRSQNSSTDKINAGGKDSSTTQNFSRVAQTFKEFKGRSNIAQTSQTVKGPNTQSNAGGSKHSWRQLKNNDDFEEINPKIRVLVSGFPAYTQSQDLTRVMSRFGKCQVDSCRNRLAVVTFESEAEAKSAIRASTDINIYGEFVDIKPYTNPKHVDDLYKAFKKVITTQKGDDITMPNQIDLTGDFFQQLENIQNAIRLTREQAQAINNLYGDLEMVLQQEWPGCVTIPFGSIPTGLGIKSSDADCYVELPEAYRARSAGGGAATFVTRARRLLQQYPNVFTRLLAIPRANTPIVKFRHVPSGFHCDVSAKTPLGAQNSKLIKLLLEHDDRLAHVAVLIKYWAKIHELSGTGKLTNYALTMMVIFYLQQPAVGLVPAVERLQRDPSTRYIVDHWNAGFSSRKLRGAPNTASLPDLLGGFFEYYAGFDFEKLVVCPYLGVAVPKIAFENPHTLPLHFARYVGNVRDNLTGPIRNTTAFCVQDPFEQSHNVASSVCPKLSAEIQAFIKFAAEAYAADRVNDCRNFLRTILLTKPKMRPDRVTPSTNIALIPRIRGQIKDDDWKSIVREIIISCIFKKMLKLHLKREEKDEKKERGRRKVEREKYIGSATKPVWRRRKATRIQMQHLETSEQLIARQAAYTDEIINSATVAVLHFEIEFWFREEPKNCNLSFKMLEGDMDAFRQFVSFLHSFVMDWFRVLLRPHLAATKEDPNQAVLDTVESETAKAECTIEFEREPPRPRSPPRLVLDPTEITRELNAVTLKTDTDSSDSCKKENCDQP